MSHIGNIIRTIRTEQNISQEELSFGLCSTSYLSRIENGKQVPGKALFENLMARLNAPIQVYMFMSSKDEIEIHNLKHKIRKHIVFHEYGEAKKILEVLESKKNLSLSCLQFIERIKVCLMHRNSAKKANLSEILTLYEKALKMTFPNYDYRNLSKHLLTRDEITIINNIANLHAEIGQRDLAIEEYYALKNYYEQKVVDSEEKASIYTGILSNLTKHLGLCGRSQESIDLCDMGIEHCLNFNKLNALPVLLLNKSCSLVDLGKADEAIPFFQESYYIYRAVGKTESCKRIENYFLEKGISHEYLKFPSFGLNN